jgi:hypothetical protein
LIWHLHRSEGLSQWAIARQLGIARDTVAGALDCDHPPKYQRASTDPVTALMGTLGSRLVQLKPYDAESKGIVERANRYPETSILPGRSFTSPEDLNSQLSQ